GQVVFVLQDIEPQSQRGITPRRQRRFHPARIAHHVVALSGGGGFVLADVHVDRGGQVGVDGGIAAFEVVDGVAVVPERRTSQHVAREQRRLGEQDLRAQQSAIGVP